MPIKHSALRQIGRDRQRHERNQAVRTELKTLTKRLVMLLHQKQSVEARQLLQRVVSKLDRATSRGVLHRNTAARAKSRLTDQVKAASS